MHQCCIWNSQNTSSILSSEVWATLVLEQVAKLAQPSQLSFPSCLDFPVETRSKAANCFPAFCKTSEGKSGAQIAGTCTFIVVRISCLSYHSTFQPPSVHSPFMHQSTLIWSFKDTIMVSWVICRLCESTNGPWEHSYWGKDYKIPHIDRTLLIFLWKLCWFFPFKHYQS